ncbi:MAG: hypothetical protein ACOC90_05200 [Bacteroidota bacterium]
MNEEALIFMLVAQTTVTAITVYFFVKSLLMGSKKQKVKEENH